MYNTYYTYIMSSPNNSTLYIGVTNDIEREKKLKKWRREKKEWLIKTLNPDLMDLGKNITI